MSTGIGGGQSPITPLIGENGGAYKTNPSQEEFNDEFALVSNRIDTLAQPDSFMESSSRIKSPFSDNDGSASAREENQNRNSLFYSAMSMARTIAHHFVRQESKQEQKNGGDNKESPSDSNETKSFRGSFGGSYGSDRSASQSGSYGGGYKGLPDLTIQIGNDNSSSTGRTSYAGTDNNSNTSRTSYAGSDNNSGTDRISYAGVNDSVIDGGHVIKDLTYYKPSPQDYQQIVINSPQLGPVQAQLNPLQAPDGQVVRAQNGQPLVSSIGMLDQSGRMGLVDLMDASMASQSRIAQQGLIYDATATARNAGSVVLHRQDGARIEYQPYVAPDGSMQARMIAMASQDVARTYYYNNPNNPGLATHIKDYVRDAVDGSFLEQERVRVGNSDTFQMSEYKTLYGQKTLVRTETEKYVQTRVDGQIVYKRDTLQDTLQRDRNGEFNNARDLMGRPVSRQEILNNLLNDSAYVVANDLASSKRHLLNVTQGRLFGGNSAKAAFYIDQYITRVREQRELGYRSASDDQLAQSLRQVASIFTTRRTGTAAQMTDAMLNIQTEDMLRSMGNPIHENNQGQIGSCYVNSYRIVAEYAYPHMVLDKWASIMSTGQTKDGRAKFSAGELMTKSYRGTTPFDFIMTSACWKKRAGAKSKLGPMNRGTNMDQAKPEFAWLTGGGKLPHSQAEAKRLKMNSWIFFTPGHARTKATVKNAKTHKTVVHANNTWDGSGEPREPGQSVTELKC